MTSIRKVALACMTAAAVTMAANAGAQTGPRNQDTFFTFSQPVELPNTTLPAGTYFFQLMDSDTNRHIVKVMSQDRKELFATLMAIPFYSNDRPSDEPQVRFMETPASASNSSNSAPAGTNAIKLWFYPGRTVGHEFIYPRKQAMQIASRSGQSVLTTKTDTEVAADSELSRVNGSGIDAAVDTEASNQSSGASAATANTQTASAQNATEQSTAQREPVGAISGSQPAPERAETQTPAATPAPTPAPATTSAPTTDRMANQTTTPARTDRTDLPRTAGVLPLLALMGLGSLAGSRLMRRARQ